MSDVTFIRHSKSKVTSFFHMGHCIVFSICKRSKAKLASHDKKKEINIKNILETKKYNSKIYKN